VSWKGTLALLTLAVAALLFLLFSGRSHTRSVTEPLLALHPTEVVQITVREGGGEIVLSRTNGVWMIGAGSPAGSVSDRADQRLIRALIEQAAGITALDILNPSDLKGSVSLESLDLKTPKRSLTFLEGRDGAGRKLAFGIEGAAKGQIYARLDGGKTVYLIPSEVVPTAFRPAEEFRDRRLTSLDPDRVEEINLTKGSALHLLSMQKGASGWNLTSPMTARGNDKVVSAWVTAILASKVDHWMPVGTDPMICGMDAPVAVLSARESGSTSPVTVTIGSAVPGFPDSFFVRCSDRPGISVVQGLAANLQISPSLLRARQPKPQQLDAIDKIEIHHPEQLGSGESFLVFARMKGSDAWEIAAGGKGTLSREQVEAWFGKLQSLTADTFEPATPDKLESAGLTHPTRIRLIAHLSENTAEESAGDLTLAEYAFGIPRNASVSFREGTSSDLMILPESALELTKGPGAISEGFNR
jgi:hypothetical protein